MSDAAQSAKPNWLANNLGRITIVCVAVAILGVLGEVGAGVGYRLEIMPLQLALLKVLPGAAYVTVAGVVLCALAIVLSIVVHKGEFISRSAGVIAVLVVAAIAAYVPYSLSQKGRSVPPIHDISTDLENPPPFVDVVPLRTGARNPPEYLVENKLGQNVINVPDAQRKAYPDIQPVMLAGVQPADAFVRALKAVEKHNWHVVAKKPEEGRIEAWDKTPWFGFIDDVVIRVSAVEDGSRIDIRSLSRVGGSDVGKNAQRIRAYLVTLAGIKN